MPEVVLKNSNIYELEKDTSLSTSHVTHFTREFSNLTNILRAGFRPSICGETPIHLLHHWKIKAIIDFMGLESTPPNQIEIPMVCFCDIPLSLSNEHRSRYGKYAISLNKTWAIINELSPVFYVSNDSANHMILYSIRDKLELLKRGFHASELTEAEMSFIDDLDMSINDLWNNIKPFCNEDSSVKYYDEREWRFIPKSYKIESKNDESTYLKFVSTDVCQIVVTNLKERKFVRKLLDELGFDQRSLCIKIKR